MINLSTNQSVSPEKHFFDNVNSMKFGVLLRHLEIKFLGRNSLLGGQCVDEYLWEDLGLYSHLIGFHHLRSKRVTKIVLSA